MLIGVTGTIGAGKGMVVKILEKNGFKHFSVSDFLANEAHARSLPLDRVTRRLIANEFRAHGGENLIQQVYASAVPDIEKGVDVVIESLHTKAEVDFIHRMQGIVISVDASLPVRYKRIQKRAEIKDQVTFEEFEREQTHQLVSANPDENNLIRAMEGADFCLKNEGTPEELSSAISDILKNLKVHV